MLGVEVVPYAEVVDVLDDIERPAAICADGRIYYGDCVLIADGTNSKLRTTVFGVPTVEKYNGYSIHRSIMKTPESFEKDSLCSREWTSTESDFLCNGSCLHKTMLI